MTVAGVLAVVVGCSPTKVVTRQVADTLADSGSGTAWTGDDDPELVASSMPFALKTMESLLESDPQHVGLLTALASGFTQYGYAFVHQPADMLDAKNPSAAREGWLRARKLYRRAHEYALRGLEVKHRGFRAALKLTPQKAAAMSTQADVPLLYWAAGSLALLITVSKDQPDVIAELPAAGAMVERALSLQESYDKGALHEFMVSYESRSPAMGGDLSRAERHFKRALELTEGRKASPYLSWAESVCVQKQDRACFDDMVNKALAVDVNAVPAYRLANVLAQRRATWLKGRVEDLILTADETEEEQP